MESSPFIQVGLPIALFIIMIGMGLSLTPRDFHRVVEQPRGVLVGTLGQMIGVPLLGFLVAAMLSPASGILAAGMVLVALCPGGTTSNLICYLAKADLALSITLTVISSFLTILTIPPLLNLALELYAGNGEVVHLPFTKTLITMTVIVLIPTMLGMGLRAWQPRLAQRLEPGISKFSALVLIAIVVAIVATQWDNLLNWVAIGFLPALLMNIAAIAGAWLLARVTGLNHADRLTVMVELSLKNTTIGLLVALTLIGNVELAIPSAIYGLLMYAGAFVMVTYGRRAATAQTQRDFAPSPGKKEAASFSPTPP